MIWITRVVVGIVVEETHAQLASRCQVHGTTVTVIALPVEIPVWDREQLAFGAIRQNRKTLQPLAEVMCVRQYREQVDVNRQGEAVLNRVLIRPWRDVDIQTAKGKDQSGIGRGSLSEIQSHLGLESLLLARRAQVSL